MPPPKPRCHELLVKKASDRLNITCIPARLSIITKPLNGRMACHYCGQCNRGCQVKANFSSGDVLIAPALADRQADAHHERDGARGDDRAGRPRDRRVVHRQEHDDGRARPREGRRAGGERDGDRRACYSTRSRARSRTDSPTRAAPSASISPTPPAPVSPGTFRR